MEDSKTLDRSLRLLFELARNPEGLSVTELARRLGTQRPPLYRQLKTLTRYRMIRRDSGKLYRLGTGILELAQFVSGSIVDVVKPLLQEAADAAEATALLVVSEGDALVTLFSIRPTLPGTYLHTPPGFVHPVGLGAPQLAMQALGQPSEGDSDDLKAVRAAGYAMTTGFTTEGRTAAAAGVRLAASSQIGVVLLVTDDRSQSKILTLPGIVLAAAQQIEALFENNYKAPVNLGSNTTSS